MKKFIALAMVLLALLLGACTLQLPAASGSDIPEDVEPTPIPTATPAPSPTEDAPSPSPTEQAAAPFFFTF